MVQQTDLVTKLIDLLEPEAEKHGYELVAVEQSGGRRTPVIRVLLDRGGGIDLEAITTANRWVSDLLEATDPISGPYTLEVSSPGIDRPLRKLSDFDRFAGETVNIKTRGHGGRNAWTGTLVGTSSDDVLVSVDGQEVRVPFGDIAKARIKGVVDFSSRKGGDQ